mgnify:CR=1 FL=1
MLTKQQVFDAALKYAQEQNPDESKAAIMPDGDFIAGAFWAADLLEAEIHLRQETISGYQQVLAARTEALEAIIDRYEVANMLAGDDPVIGRAKEVLEKL